MLSKYSVLALIGAANAATAAPLRGTTATWPKFAAAAAPASGDLGLTTALNSVLPKWTNATVPKGNYKGYRADILTFPMQKITIAAAANTFALVAALATGERTFYLTDKAKFPAQSTSATITTAGFTGTAATGTAWNVCLTYTTALLCNGGVSLFCTDTGGNNTCT